MTYNKAMDKEWQPKLFWSLAMSVIVVFILVVAFGGLKRVAIPEIKIEKKVFLGQCEFKVTLAQTTQEQARGLMDIKNLASDQALVFPFDKSDIKTFWMKNMLIPIDLIWLNESKVIGWEENMLPDNGERIYQSPSPANLVVEAAAGAVKRCKIELNIGIRF